MKKMFLIGILLVLSFSVLAEQWVIKEVNLPPEMVAPGRPANPTVIEREVPIPNYGEIYAVKSLMDGANLTRVKIVDDSDNIFYEAAFSGFQADKMGEKELTPGLMSEGKTFSVRCENKKPIPWICKSTLLLWVKLN